MLKIRPSDIFGDRAEKFFHALTVFIEANSNKIEVDIEKEMANIVLSDELYRLWKILNRTDQRILDRMLDKVAADGGWNWIRLREFQGIDSQLFLALSV